MIKLTLLTATTLSIFATVNDFHHSLPTPVKFKEQLKEDSQMVATRLALIEAKAPENRLETLTRSSYYAGKATGIDPILVASIIAPESEYNVSAKSKKGYKGLMQRPKARMNWEFAETDVMDGACLLRQKLQIAKGDMNLAMALYKGGKSKEARDIAKAQLKIYHDIKSKVNEQMKG